MRRNTVHHIKPTPYMYRYGIPRVLKKGNTRAGRSSHLNPRPGRSPGPGVKSYENLQTFTHPRVTPINAGRDAHERDVQATLQPVGRDGRGLGGQIFWFFKELSALAFWSWGSPPHGVKYSSNPPTRTEPALGGRKTGKMRDQDK